ncbi:MAG: hypothetical protein FWF83_07715, partial [Clostridiales bacterium]|nr:hypothetical protein [Clostridiales bacterium]
MEKTLQINTGSALLFNEKSEKLSGYDSVSINAGHMIISQKVYEKLADMGISINSGNMHIVEVTGDIVTLAGGTAITSATSYAGCYLVCDGHLIVEDAKGLEGITGLYAGCLFRPESVNLSTIRGITAASQVVYPDKAKLHIGNLAIDEAAPITLDDDTLYWIHGSMKALDGAALEKMLQKGTTFHCGRLIIYTGLYEKYKALVKADRFTFIPDGHRVVDDVALDAATVSLYGDKLYVLNDLMIPHDQVPHIQDFSSLIVNNTATMPVAAAAAFQSVGKAGAYELYEGILLNINGIQTFVHEQCQTAIDRSLVYTLKINGALYFAGDVTVQDMDAIAAVYCNGLIGAPDQVRGVLESKVREMNGTILNVDSMVKKEYGEDSLLDGNPISMIKKLMGQIQGDGDGNTIN